MLLYLSAGRFGQLEVIKRISNCVDADRGSGREGTKGQVIPHGENQSGVPCSVRRRCSSIIGINVETRLILNMRRDGFQVHSLLKPGDLNKDRVKAWTYISSTSTVQVPTIGTVQVLVNRGDPRRVGVEEARDVTQTHASTPK